MAVKTCVHVPALTRTDKANIPDSLIELHRRHNCTTYKIMIVKYLLSELLYVTYH